MRADDATRQHSGKSSEPALDGTKHIPSGLDHDLTNLREHTHDPRRVWAHRSEPNATRENDPTPAGETAANAPEGGERRGTLVSYRSLRNARERSQSGAPPKLPKLSEPGETTGQTVDLVPRSRITFLVT